MTTPIEQLMAGADWQPIEIPAGAAESGMPYSTHFGVFQLGDLQMRCYRLNTGQAVLHADDVFAYLMAFADGC